MHDLLCKERCSCGKICYSHPDMSNREHKCKDCLIFDNELIEEDIGFSDGIKSLIYDFKIIIRYVRDKLKGVRI